MPSAASGYGSLLRLPGAAAFFFAAAVGRVGLAMTGIGLVWLSHARTGSYGTAGQTAAAFALAEALIGPQLARLTDRFGQTRVLPLSLLGHGLAVAGVLSAASRPALVACAACAGAAVPQLGSLSAARWAGLLRAERSGDLPAAFSLESLANATAFLLGPVLVTALGAAGRTGLASGLAAALVVGGGGVLAAQRRTAPLPGRTLRREDVPARATGRGSARGLTRPGFLLLALLNVAIGLYFGTMSVSISAFAVGHGTPGAATPITAAASLGGLLAGWLYGRRRHSTPANLQLIVVTAYLTGTSLLLPFAPSAAWLGVASVATEAAVPPTLVLLTVLTERSVPDAVLTQAFTWNNSASAAGSALAAWLAGRTADRLGASAAFALAPAAGLVLLLLALAARRHHTDRPAVPAARQPV
ncbi:MFS transporter [Actinacidiphila acidipaludis]|uniref:MFS transporter n=1 Tax=Actinacidiphila acidipaludis TaxID=2873382 RepID=A0ABS7QGZ0_9ACTN|nr:MFS transporter [Streptomyces acidipaludis]MBY8882441.1 MFS transporter [Streptomyces acidipaludis]